VPVKLEQLLRGIACVPPEYLVTAVPGEQEPDAVRLRHSGTIISGNRRRVSERLINGPGDERNGVQDILRSHVVFVRPRTEMARCNARVGHFVEPFGGEADGIGICGAAQRLRKNARNRGAVGSAAEKGPGRPAIERPTDRGAQQSLEFGTLFSSAASSGSSTHSMPSPAPAPPSPPSEPPAELSQPQILSKRLSP
jgi:hypothetical protein